MFRIGDFSKIAQVSGRLLRYYDDLGLLPPAIIDPETGYRYYSIRQLPRLNRILVLKELGLTLNQIATLLQDHISTDEIRGMLKLREAELEQTIREQVAGLQNVRSRLESLEATGELPYPDVLLKAVPAQPFLATRMPHMSLAGLQGFLRRLAEAMPTTLGQRHDTMMATIIHSPVFDPDDLEVEVGYFTTSDIPQMVRLSEEEILRMHRLPAVPTMATVVHVGAVSRIHQSYAALGWWIEHHGWQLDGAGRHALLQWEVAEEAIVEIQLPVTPSAEAHPGTDALRNTGA